MTPEACSINLSTAVTDTLVWYIILKVFIVNCKTSYNCNYLCGNMKLFTVVRVM